MMAASLQSTASSAAPSQPATGSALVVCQTIGFTGFTLSVDLSLPGNGVTALFGPSGSGKTTLLRAIAGLIPGEGRGRLPSANRVVVNGEVWQDAAQGIFRSPHTRAMGYVFQEASLFGHLNVAQNLAYGQTRVPAAQRRVSLDQAVELLGIGHLSGRDTATLSGGERQRVAIARALATSPQILLMDEPLAALDAQRKAEVLPYLARLHAELSIPILYVSHALDEVARLADHLVLLQGGRVTASGPTADLMTRLDSPMAQGDAAGAVLTATVASHDAKYHLSLARFAGGEITLSQMTDAPGQAKLGQTVRLRVQARDVSLTLARQTGTSIQNILPVTVTGIAPDSPGQVMVRLDAGGSTLLARITRKSADSLQLEVGQPLFAQVKGVAVVG